VWHVLPSGGRGEPAVDYPEDRRDIYILSDRHDLGATEVRGMSQRNIDDPLTRERRAAR